MLVADLHLCWPGSPVQETLIALPQVAGLGPTPGPGRGLRGHVRKIGL